MSIERIIEGKLHDLGGFSVRRVLPAPEQRMVGPFIFVDHVGPAEFAAGHGINVRPHPHIGLATVTYLFEGEFMHRDSLGSVQRIAPGDVNWMSAGHGIVHSERSPADQLQGAQRVEGMQTWVALPDAHEEDMASFEHHPAASLPQLSLPGVQICVIAGNAFGARAPVNVLSPTLYCALEFEFGAGMVIPNEHTERAVYVINGELEVDGQLLRAGQMAIFTAGVSVPAKAHSAARAMLLGGSPVGERFIQWNFVASSREKIIAARDEWDRYADIESRGRFGSIAGETEFIAAPPR